MLMLVPWQELEFSYFIKYKFKSRCVNECREDKWLKMFVGNCMKIFFFIILMFHDLFLSS